MRTSLLALIAAANLGGSLAPSPVIQTIEPSLSWTGTDEAIPTASMVPYGTGIDRVSANFVDVAGVWVQGDGLVTGVIGGLNDREGIRYVEYGFGSATLARVTGWYWDSTRNLPIIPIKIRSRTLQNPINGDNKLWARVVPVNGLERIIVLPVTLNTYAATALPRTKFQVNYAAGSDFVAGSTSTFQSITTANTPLGGTSSLVFKTMTGLQVALGNAATSATPAIQALANGAIGLVAGGQTYYEITKGSAQKDAQGNVLNYGTSTYDVPRLVEFIPDPSVPGTINVTRVVRNDNTAVESVFFWIRLTKLKYSGMTFSGGDKIVKIQGARKDQVTTYANGPRDICWFDNVNFIDAAAGPYGQRSYGADSQAAQTFFHPNPPGFSDPRYLNRWALTNVTASNFIFTGATFELNCDYTCTWDVHFAGSNYDHSPKLNVRARVIADFWASAGVDNPIVNSASYFPNAIISSDGTKASIGVISGGVIGTNSGVNLIKSAIVAGQTATVLWSTVSGDIGKVFKVGTVTNPTAQASFALLDPSTGAASSLTAGSSALLTIPGVLYPITQINLVSDGTTTKSLGTSTLPNQGGSQCIYFDPTGNAGGAAGNLTTAGYTVQFQAPCRAVPAGVNQSYADYIRVGNERIQLNSISADGMSGVLSEPFVNDITSSTAYYIDSNGLTYSSTGSPYRTSAYIAVMGDLTGLLAQNNTFDSIGINHGDLGQFGKPINTALSATPIQENLTWFNYYATGKAAQPFLMQTRSLFMKYGHTGLTVASDGMTCSLASWIASVGEGAPGVGDLVTVGSVTAKIVSVSSTTAFTVEANKLSAQNNVSWSKTATIVGVGTDSATGLDTITFSSDVHLVDNTLIFQPGQAPTSGFLNYVAGYTTPLFGDGGDTWQVAPANFLPQGASTAVPSSGGYNSATKTALVLPNGHLRPTGTDGAARTMQPGTTFLAMTGLKDWWICNSILGKTAANGTIAHLEEGTCINLTIARSLIGGTSVLALPISGTTKGANTGMARWRFFDSIFMTDTYTRPNDAMIYPDGSTNSYAQSPSLTAASIKPPMPQFNGALSIGTGRTGKEADYLLIDNCQAQASSSLGQGTDGGRPAVNTDWLPISGVSLLTKLPTVGLGFPPFDIDGKILSAAMLIGPKH